MDLHWLSQEDRRKTVVHILDRPLLLLYYFFLFGNNNSDRLLSRCHVPGTDVMLLLEWFYLILLVSPRYREKHAAGEVKCHVRVARELGVAWGSGWAVCLQNPCSNLFWEKSLWGPLALWFGASLKAPKWCFFSFLNEIFLKAKFSVIFCVKPFLQTWDVMQIWVILGALAIIMVLFPWDNLRLIVYKYTVLMCDQCSSTDPMATSRVSTWFYTRNT